jgi:hypothetical protein
MNGGSKHERRASRERRRALLELATAHAMWPRGEQDAVCSCGHECVDDYWFDDVMLTAIRFDDEGERPNGHDSFVIAYPIPTPEMSMGGVVMVQDGSPTSVSQQDVAWLVDQAEVSEIFRRAAAVHLDQAT